MVDLALSGDPCNPCLTLRFNFFQTAAEKAKVKANNGLSHLFAVLAHLLWEILDGALSLNFKSMFIPRESSKDQRRKFSLSPSAFRSM